DARVLALVLAQVDRVARLRDRAERRLGNLDRGADERDDGAVVARVEALVDDADAADGADRVEGPLHDLRAASFAEVGAALDEPGHAPSITPGWGARRHARASARGRRRPP